MAANARIDVNADMGEGFGRWTLGDDAALMPFVTSVNIACGQHAGDPHIMRRCVRLAKRHGVGVGAHVGFPDLAGFGRRNIGLDPAQLQDYVTYQVGALMGFAAAEGVEVQHVKPHSALYKLCMEDDDASAAMVAAVRSLDRRLILVMSGDRPARAAALAGLPYVGEALIDLEYDEHGAYVPEWPKQSWDPALAAARAVAVVREGMLPLRGGGQMPVRAGSLGLHGDAGNAADLARVVRGRLAAEGIEVVPLREIVGVGGAG